MNTNRDPIGFVIPQPRTLARRLLNRLLHRTQPPITVTIRCAGTIHCARCNWTADWNGDTRQLADLTRHHRRTHHQP